MGLSPSWESGSVLAIQEIRRDLWNLNVHYHVCSSLPFVHILSQISPVHAFPSCFFKIQFNIILQLKPRPCKWCLYFRFPSHMCHMPRPSHHPWFDHTVIIWLSVPILKFFILQFSSFSSPFFLGLNFFLSTPRSNTSAYIFPYYVRPSFTPMYNKR